MKFQHLLVLSFGLSSVILPSVAIAQSKPQPNPPTIAAQSTSLPIPKLKQDTQATRDTKSILQDEAAWLRSTQYMERYEKLAQFKRELVAVALDNQKTGIAVPSSATINYFAKIVQEFPQSGIAANLYAESIINGSTDTAKIEQAYAPIIAKHSTHPILLRSYSEAMLDRDPNKLPSDIRIKLNNIYDRAILQEPQNLSLYLDRARNTVTSTDNMVQQWKTVATKIPNNPQVAVEFAKLIANQQANQNKPAPKDIATAIQQVEAAIGQYPKVADLYQIYAYFHSKANTAGKALPLIQAGLKKGADPVALNYLIGDFYLVSGSEPQAISHYQKVVQAKAPLCETNMAERFKVLKQPEQQRAILNLMIQSLNFDRDNQCSTWLSQIGLDPTMNQRFGKEMITAITPIAQSSSNITIHQLLLELMQKQKQYAAITTIGPKLLPSNGAELDIAQFLVAETMPLTIAQAHEKLGSLDQATKFYELLGEYHRQLYGMSLTERNISYITSWHLGRLAWKQGKADQAIALLQPVTTHKLADWGATMEDGSEVSYRALAYNLLGEIFQSQGKRAEAKQQFEASAKADKGFQTPKDNLAKLK